MDFVNEDSTRKELLFSYLNIKTEKERNLKVRAYAELILKSFYLNDERGWLDINSIKNIVEDFSGIQKISEQAIAKSLKFLTNELSYLSFDENNKKWSIKESSLKSITDNITENRKCLDTIIEKFLSSEMDKDKVRGWFLCICEKIFLKEEEDFLNSFINNNSSSIKNFKVEKELENSIREYELESFKEDLTSAFNDFINNLSDDNSNFLFLLSQNILTSKIVAIDLDVDSLFIDLLKGSKILIDTNVFICQVLNEGKFNDLFQSLKDLNSQFFYIDKTKEEFEHTIRIKKRNMISIAEKRKFLKEINIFDDFYNLAKKYECKKKEDFERFFDNNFSFPPVFGQAEIKELSSEDHEIREIKTAIEKEVNSKTSQRVGILRYKNDYVLTHDLLLNDMVIKLRENKEKAIILTEDEIMRSFSFNNMKGRDKLPIWIHAKAMVSIVAANVPYKEGFSKIFKIMLKDSCCMQKVEGFNLEDIRCLMDGCRDIQIENYSWVSECANIVRRHRLNGGSINDEMKRQLDDIFMRKRSSEINEVKNELKKEKKDKEREIKKRDSILMDREKKKIKKKNILKYIFILLLYVGGAFLLSILFYKISKLIWRNDGSWNAIYVTIFIAFEGTALGGFCWIHGSDFKKHMSTNNIYIEAEKNVKKLLQSI